MDPNTPQTSTPVSPAPQSAATQKPEEWKLVVTILALLIFTPLGIIFMWLWMKNWPKWLKILLTVLFVVIPLMILMLVGFTVYRGIQDAAKNANYRATQVISTPAPASDSAQIATSSAELASFDSPCVNFKYPASFRKTREEVFQDHNLVEGKDQFGSTTILLSKDLEGKNYRLELSCNNPANGSNAKSDIDLLIATDAYKNSGSMQKLQIGSLEATKLLINNTGRIIIIGYGKNYHIYIGATSQQLKLDDPQNEINKDLGTIINTISLKNIFK